MKDLWNWSNANRPASLIAVFFASVLFGYTIDWLLGGHLYRRVFYPDFTSPAGARAWSAIIYTVIFIFGIPTAFLLWVWRDRNVRDQLIEKKNEVKNQRLQLDVLRKQVDVQGGQIEHQAKQLEIQSDQLENQRKDIFLKEFQEVRKVAAGLFDIEGAEGAKIQLQIAAMHQLRGFLQEEYPSTFRRASFELLLAGHAHAVTSSTENVKPSSLSHFSLQDYPTKNFDTVSIERTKIIRDDAKIIFSMGFSLQGRKFDFINFSNLNFSSLNFSGSSFFGADLGYAKLVNCWISRSDFTGTYLRQAKLNGLRGYSGKFHNAHAQESNWQGSELSSPDFTQADLKGAIFDECTFANAKFKNSNLAGASFKGANMKEALFVGADLTDLKIDDKTDLDGSKFDDETVFSSDWKTLSEAAKADYRCRWRDRGMRHVDDIASESASDGAAPF